MRQYPANRADAPGSRVSRAANVNGPGVSASAPVPPRAKPPAAAEGAMPGDPRSWEMVSVWDWVSPSGDEGLVGTGWAGPGLQRQPRSLQMSTPTPSGAGRPCVSSSSWVGPGGRRGRAAGPVTARGASAPEPLCARSPVSPRWCGDRREGRQGTVVTPRFPAWRTCGPWASNSFLPSQADAFSPECSQSLGSGVSNPQPCTLCPPPPQSDNNCLHFQAPPCIPKRQFPFLIQEL